VKRKQILRQKKQFFSRKSTYFQFLSQILIPVIVRVMFEN
jgi:hypothetical protein